MKTRIVKIVIFCSILILSDFVIGKALKSGFESSNDINIFRLNYTLNKTNQDVLILGSSRALHHFVSSIISKQINMSVYNCGFAGQGLKFSFLQLHAITKRYKPKKIILEISPNILLDEESDQKLKVLMPYCQKDSVFYNVLIGNDVFERTKLISRIYPFNSLIFDIAYSKYKFTKDSFNGFMPLYGKLLVANNKQVENAFDTNATLKVEYLHKIITTCLKKRIDLYIVVSPMFNRSADAENVINKLSTLLSKYKSKNVYFLEYSKFDSTSNHTGLFKDNLHLNTAGADVFSREVSRVLHN